jgi:hypothetical protein
MLVLGCGRVYSEPTDKGPSNASPDDVSRFFHIVLSLQLLYLCFISVNTYNVLVTIYTGHEMAGESFCQFYYRGSIIRVKCI